MEKTYFVYMIIAVVFLISGLALVLLSPQSFEAKEEVTVTTVMRETVQTSDYNISENEIENILTEPRNSTENIESSIFHHLPDDARIVIGFYDGHGREIDNSSMIFSIVNNEIIQGQINDWEVKILTGNYNIPRLLQTEDICNELNQLKQEEDFRVYTNSDPVTLLVKYDSLNNCINLR